MGIGTDDQLTRERVILQHDLMHDAGARPPEARVVLGRGPAQEIVDLGIFIERFLEILSRCVTRLDEVVAMDARRDRDALAPALHELQDPRLPEQVLEDDPIGTQQQVALARSELLPLGIVEMSEQYFFREGQRPLQPAAHDFESALHGAIDSSRHLGCRFDARHGAASV